MKMVMVVVKWASSYNDDGDEEILFAVPIQWQCDNDNIKDHNDVRDEKTNTFCCSCDWLVDRAQVQRCARARGRNWQILEGMNVQSCSKDLLTWKSKVLHVLNEGFVSPEVSKGATLSHCPKCSTSYHAIEVGHLLVCSFSSACEKARLICVRRGLHVLEESKLRGI